MFKVDRGRTDLQNLLSVEVYRWSQRKWFVQYQFFDRRFAEIFYDRNLIWQIRNWYLLGTLRAKNWVSDKWFCTCASMEKKCKTKWVLGKCFRKSNNVLCNSRCHPYLLCVNKWIKEEEQIELSISFFVWKICRFNILVLKISLKIVWICSRSNCA